MTRAEQRLEELRVFELFAAAADLGLVSGSIEQPDPPDIVCALRDFPRIAFELTRLDDPEELRRKSDWLRTQELWESVVSELSDHERVHIVGEFAQAQIDLHVESDANQRLRRVAFRALARSILALPPGFCGHVPLALEHVIRSANLRRFASIKDGPLVFSYHAGWTAPVDFSRIDAKISSGGCVPDCRLELLAYARWNDPLSIHHHDASDYLAQRIPGSRFARCWIFEVMTNRVIARSP